VRSSASSFNFAVSFRFFNVIQDLPSSSSSSSRHVNPSLHLTFINVFQKAVPMQDVINPVSFSWFVVCRMFLSSFTLRITPSFLTRSVQLIFSDLSSTTFQIFPGISNLLSEVFKFQHQTKLCFKCGTLLVPSLNWIQILWWKESSSRYAIAILDWISFVQLSSLVIMQPKYLKYSILSKCFWRITNCIGDGCLQIFITSLH
jgi:hypothetical protein